MEGCGVIATMIFSTSLLLLLVFSFPAVVEMSMDECLMLEVNSLSLSIMGQRVPLTFSKCSLTVVDMLETSNLRDKSVSKIAIEHMYTLIVLGIFWVSVICSSEVSKLLSVMGWDSIMSFLTSRKLWASFGG